jgi:hypothetical protein
MTLNSNFKNREKLVPIQKPTQMFGLKFGMQGFDIHMLLVVKSHAKEQDRLVFKGHFDFEHFHSSKPL